MPENVSKIVQLILLAVFSFSNLTEGLKCPGKCMKDPSSCRAKGGKIDAYCIDGTVCCDMSAIHVGSCGSNKTGKTATFQSPEYPDFQSGDLICSFKFQLQTHYEGLMVEFLDVYTEGIGWIPHSPCETDMIFLQGFKLWTPPARCGNLTGYVVVIDKTVMTGEMNSLTILAFMTSKRYKWKIKVSHLSIAKKREASQVTGLGELTSEYLSTSQGDDSSQQTIDSGLDLIDPLVVNGKDTIISEVPWQASIRQYYSESFLKKYNNSAVIANINKEKVGCENEGKHFCGGSIISDRHILSASHCFYLHSKLIGMRRIDDMKVFLGETDLCLNDEVKYGHSIQNHSVEKVIIHYAYDDQNNAINDVAVLKLTEKIKFTEYIKPIALSKRNKSYVGKEVKVSGWGLTNLTVPLETAKLPLILQSTDAIYVQNDSFCHPFLERGFGTRKIIVQQFPKYNTVFSAVLCTEAKKNETGDKLVGQGDSGGPLIITEGDQQPIQIGIVSYGLPVYEAKEKHDNVFVDFYQDVSYYRDWIDLAMSV